MRTIILSPDAERDLDEIYLYNSTTHSENRAQKIVSDLLDKIQALTFENEVWPDAQSKNKFMKRKVVNKTYSVYYKIVESEVYVLRVWHHARNPDHI
jgi:plasmid stabilization system protein ParE